MNLVSDLCSRGPTSIQRLVRLAANPPDQNEPSDWVRPPKAKELVQQQPDEGRPREVETNKGAGGIPTQRGAPKTVGKTNPPLPQECHYRKRQDGQRQSGRRRVRPYLQAQT